MSTVPLILCWRGQGFQFLPQGGVRQGWGSDPVPRPLALLTRWLTFDDRLRPLGISFFCKIE